MRVRASARRVPVVIAQEDAALALDTLEVFARREVKALRDPDGPIKGWGRGTVASAAGVYRLAVSPDDPALPPVFRHVALR